MTTDPPAEGEPEAPTPDISAIPPATAQALGAVLASMNLDALPTTGPIRGNVDGSVVVDCSDDGPVILDRPTFGQIKKIIRAGTRLDDALTVLDYQAKADRTAIDAEWTALDGATTDERGRPVVDVNDTNLPRLVELRDEARKRADAIEDGQFAALAEFWQTVFGIVLPADKIPAEDTWPSEIVDLGLHRKVIAHWRYVPAGPG